MANWQAPANVITFSTTRALGDFSYQSPTNAEKITALCQQYNFQANWLKQVHSNLVIAAPTKHNSIEADALFTNKVGVACCILSADCLPILVCNTTGTWIGAIHAGWRGLYQDIIKRTLNQYSQNSDLMAWIGPAISQQNYQVDSKYRDNFLKQQPQAIDAFVKQPSNSAAYIFDLKAVATSQLQQSGVNSVHCADTCTYADERWYSFRKNQTNNRILNVIGLQ